MVPLISWSAENGWAIGGHPATEQEVVDLVNRLNDQLDAEKAAEATAPLKRLLEAGDALDAVACCARCYNLNDLDRANAEIASRDWREARDALEEQ